MNKARKTEKYTIRLSEVEYNFYKKVYKLLGFKTLSAFIIASIEFGCKDVLDKNELLKEEYNQRVIEKLSDTR